MTNQNTFEISWKTLSRKKKDQSHEEKKNVKGLSQNIKIIWSHNPKFHAY